MKTFINLFIGIMIAFSLNACIINGVSGNRNVTTENREISSNFNKLSVSQGIEVILTQGPNILISVEADDNLHDLLKTEVKDSVLKIYFEKNVSTRKSSKVYLTIPTLTSINTSSGAEVNGQNTLEVSKLYVDSSSGSEINLRTNAHDIFANSSSGSNINLQGSCKYFSGNSSSGSEISARKLIAQEVKADASSGADIDITSIERFYGNASSGASIETEGNPKFKSIEKSSGGSVNVK